MEDKRLYFIKLFGIQLLRLSEIIDYQIIMKIYKENFLIF